MDLVFLETPLFTRLLGDYLSDKSYRELEQALMENPELGDVMPGTGGFRKARWNDARRGKGKRGGLRIIYYYLTADLWFPFIPSTNFKPLSAHTDDAGHRANRPRVIVVEVV